MTHANSVAWHETSSRVVPLDHQPQSAELMAQLAALDARVDSALEEADASRRTTESAPAPAVVDVWGLPLAKVTLGGTLAYLDQRIRSGVPGYFITANLNWAMLVDQDPALLDIGRQASLVTCDGMPLLWWSRILGDPLPERVAGSELIYAIAKWAANRGYRIFFLGGAPGVAGKAAQTLRDRYPGLQVAGVESPPFRPLTEEEEQRLVQQIRGTAPDIIFVAFGQPKGERWIAQHYRDLAAPVTVQLGASFDFVAGGVPRAPRWVQRSGMEWLYRTYQEPRRLTMRYARNAFFLGKSILQYLGRGRGYPRGTGTRKAAHCDRSSPR